VKLLIYTDAPILGGAEQTTGGLLEAFGGHIDVTLVGAHRPVVEALARRRPGVRFALAPSIRHKLDLGRMQRFARLIAAARPDVVQINCPTPWTCKHETLIAALTPGVRTVLIEHLPVEPDGRWIRAVKRTLVRGVDAHVAVGVAAAGELERQIGLPTGSLRVIESAVPEFAVERSNGHRSRSLIGTTARLDRQKGLDVLVRALPALPDVDVEIVGDGPERAALEALAGELGVAGRVHFAGWSDRARDWLGRWDAFVLPSRFEGLPLSILDAMLAELPVVATDVGSTAEAVHDRVTGRLVAAEDPDALATGLRDVLADPAWARELGRAGRALALERFTVQVQARRYEALYDELLS
jgi:glycosyltransferase involved in cell wall biosynthesis